LKKDKIVEDESVAYFRGSDGDDTCRDSGRTNVTMQNFTLFDEKILENIYS